MFLKERSTSHYFHLDVVFSQSFYYYSIMSAAIIELFA